MSDTSLFDRVSHWRNWRWVWTLCLVLGLLGWLACVVTLDAGRAWRALLINFVYFTPMAVGMATWPAVVMASNGAWPGSLRRAALAASYFAPVSLMAFVALWLGRAHWAAWMVTRYSFQAAWLGDNTLFIRDGIALLVLWAMITWFARRANHGRPVRLGAWLVFAYCIIVSLLGFDLVMALDPKWYSALFGGYFFISGMYIAVAGWTFCALCLEVGTTRSRLQDLGKLIVTFSLLTTYMMFSQLIVIWYENLPHEAAFVIPRLRLSPWQTISAVLLAVIYLGPLVLLLGRKWKRSNTYLAFIALAVLIGMWMERWWLVTPSLGGRMVIGLPEIAATAFFAGAFALCVRQFNRRMPATAPQEAQSP